MDDVGDGDDAGPVRGDVSVRHAVPRGGRGPGRESARACRRRETHARSWRRRRRRFRGELRRRRRRRRERPGRRDEDDVFEKDVEEIVVEEIVVEEIVVEEDASPRVVLRAVGSRRGRTRERGQVRAETLRRDPRHLPPIPRRVRIRGVSARESRRTRVRRGNAVPAVFHGGNAGGDAKRIHGEVSRGGVRTTRRQRVRGGGIDAQSARRRRGDVGRREGRVRGRERRVRGRVFFRRGRGRGENGREDQIERVRRRGR